MKRILLTGAGFTKNWGGFLATEVWERLLGHPTFDERPLAPSFTEYFFGPVDLAVRP